MLPLLLAAQLIAPAAAPGEPPAFTAPSGLHGLWSDGDGLLAAHEHSVVHLSCRTGERVSLAMHARIVDLGAAIVGGQPVLAAVDEDGQLAVWRRGAWSVRAAPPAGERLAVAVDGRGRVVVISVGRGVQRLDDATWQELPHPLELGPVLAAAVAPDGAIAVLTADGGLGFAGPDDDRLARILVLDLPKEPRHAWIGPSGALWIADDRELVRVDRSTWKIGARAHHNLFGRLRGLTGVDTPEGERLLLAAQSTAAVYDGGRFTAVPITAVFASGLAVDVRAGALLASDSRGLDVAPVDHPSLLAARDRLRATPAPACPLPPGQRSSRAPEPPRPVSKDSPTLAPPSAATSPAPAPPGERERTDFSLRAGFGAAFAPGTDPRVTTGFSFDVAVGAVAQVGKHVWLWPEVGYNYTGRASHAGHFFTAGLTPMFGQRHAQIGVGPRLVVGDAWGAPGVGVRSGLVGSVGANILTLELGHQWLRAGDRDLHDARFMFSVNVVPLVKMLALLALARPVLKYLF